MSRRARSARAATATDRTRPVRLAPADILRLGLLGIRTRKMRAALSALGISIGIATMIIVIGIPASSQKALMDELSAMGTDTLRAEPQPDQKPPVLLPEAADAMAARIGPVTLTSAVANTHAVVRRSDRIDPNDGSGLAVLASRPTSSKPSTARSAPAASSTRSPNASRPSYSATRPRSGSASTR